MRDFFRFPDPVNEVSARLVAGGVVLMSVVALIGQFNWLLPIICAGFILRVLFGPRVSPLALLVTRVIEPRLPIAPRLTPGPPKRFAQGMGAALSTVAVVLEFGFGLTFAAYTAIAFLIVAASLESIVGLCLGCRIFSVLMKVGILPESVCEACADISRHRVTS